MKEIKENKKVEKPEEDVPIATEIIRDYKKNIHILFTINRRLYYIIAILLIMIAVETTYIVIFWDSLEPNIGLIREKVKEQT